MSVTNVEKVDQSTRLLAQTTLRNFLGTKNLSEILADREEISHTMQVCLMPNSPLFFFNNLSLGTCFLQESRSTTEGFIFTFWLRCMLLPWQWGWLKTRLKQWFLFFKVSATLQDGPRTDPCSPFIFLINPNKPHISESLIVLDYG